MRAPSFWNIKHGRDSAPILRTLLMPLSYIYDYFTQKRIYEASPKYLTVPVISIGNISLGGTGKTPIAIEIANILNEIWGRPAIISRGFKSDLIGAIKVDKQNHNAKDIGDEPLMLSQYYDVFVGKDRTQAAELAIEDGAKILILDDAHQNPSLFKHISFVVIDGAVGFGNHHICPAGPLREEIQTGLKRADCIIWVGDRALEKEEIGEFNKPIFYADIIAKENNFTGKYLGFCGIGRPEKFFDSLKNSGVEIIDLIPFADHHYFTNKELKEIEARAIDQNCKIITTEKDYARLPDWFKSKVDVFKIKIQFKNQNAITKFIQQTLAKAIE